MLDVSTDFDHDRSWSDKGQREEALELAQSNAAKARQVYTLKKRRWLQMRELGPRLKECIRVLCGRLELEFREDQAYAASKTLRSLIQSLDIHPRVMTFRCIEQAGVDVLGPDVW